MVRNFPSTSQAVQIGYFPSPVTLYVRVLGAGNIRFHTDPISLTSSGGALTSTPPDGIPQAGVNGLVQYFWQGPMWGLPDTAGMNVMILVTTGNQQ